jgi:hypothetical protein
MSMSIADFYEADPRRQDSDEAVYGEGWTTEDDPHATYRCQWVEETGELYTVREPHPGGLLARYLDQLDLDQAGVGELTVEILLVELDRAVLEARLDGWQDQVEELGSLAWLHARTRGGV